MPIDPFIEQMTGIASYELEHAPLFSDIKDEIYEMLVDTIFVAHNVRFDYGFIRQEFKRLGMNFRNRHFDTVKLARILYPGHAHYNLDAIMTRHSIQNQGRHRAMGDARVLWDFFNIAKKEINEEKFEDALKTVLKKPTLPSTISQQVIDSLPETPGVYTFYGEGGSVLYIGKSINIKDRVLSHFSNDTGSTTDMKITQTIKDIETTQTAGELSALLLESTLIKTQKPIYNKVLREARKMLAIVKIQNSEGFNTIEIKEVGQITPLEIESVLGVFRSIKQIKDYIYTVCKEYKLCPKIMGFEKGSGPCFNSQIGYCSGACGGRDLKLKYNLKFDEAFYNKKVKSWKFNGPIIIKEEGESLALHLVDKWCYLGTIHGENFDLKSLKTEYRFDWDTYKILSRYLKNPYNLSRIQTVNLK
jgi:DNA polymerase III subunit epsilon